MPRKATGEIIEPKGTRKTWGLRVPYKGGRPWVPLGRSEDGWDYEKADEARERIMHEIALDIWEPPKKEAASSVKSIPDSPETFREFSEEWYELREAGWSENSKADIKGQLRRHLLPAFGDMALTEIGVEHVDRFARRKQAEGLGISSINKCIQFGAAIMEQAFDWQRVSRNVFKGRKLTAPPPKRTRCQVEQLRSLLTTAKPNMRILVSVLAGCGLRIGEALALTWADINIDAATLKVKDSKTFAGIRTVAIPQGTLWDLEQRKRRLSPRPTDRVFINVSNSGPMTVRTAEMGLKTAVKTADKELAAKGIDPIEELTPHGLRRTYADLRFGTGDDIIYVAEQGGWTDPEFVHKVYAKAIARRDELHGARLEEFDWAVNWAQRKGTKDAAPPISTPAIPHVERVSAQP